jgi:hypothetical protein
MSHLDDAVLFAAGDHLDAEARSHLARCAACRTRQSRLAAGRAIIEEVQHDSSPDVMWSAIDAKVMAAAEGASRDIRRGVVRPTRRPTVAYVGVALAAAAALVVVVQQRSARTHEAAQPNGPAAMAVRSNGNESPAAQPAARGGGVQVPATDVEGRVLLLASPVTYAARGESPRAMTARTIMRSGGRVATGERSGRAVLALHRGYRVDARAGSEFEIGALTTADMTMVLTKGEARIDGPSLDAGRVAMRAGAWTVLAKGGGFVTRLDGDAVRVRVISGKVHVAREGGEEREILAGAEIELGASATEPRLVSHDVTDVAALDERLFAGLGNAVDIPSLANATSVSLDGITLPAGLTALSLREPRMLVARAGNEEWNLAIDPNANTVAPSWRRARTVVALAANTRAIESEHSALARVSGSEPAVTTTLAAANSGATEPTQPSTAPYIAPLPPDPSGDRSSARAQLEQDLSLRAAPCYAACMANHSCGAGTVGDVHVDTERDGRISSVRVANITSTDVSECIGQTARGLRIPTFMTSQTVHLTVTPPGR